LNYSSLGHTALHFESCQGIMQNMDTMKSS